MNVLEMSKIAFLKSVAKLTDSVLLERIEGQEKSIQNMKKHIRKYNSLLDWETDVLQVFKTELEGRGKKE